MKKANNFIWESKYQIKYPNLNKLAIDKENRSTNIIIVISIGSRWSHTYYIIK